MGEYAKHNGTEIKIGTCEEMYYLRAGQAHKVRHVPGNVDPVKDREALRFRFPFPDEDGIAPGSFDKHDRGAPLHVSCPRSVEHSIVQFQAPGYNVCLPCPESTGDGESLGIMTIPEPSPTERLAGNGRDPRWLTIHRNGHPGRVQIVQQRWVGDRLVLVLACGGCGGKWREPTIEDARPYIEECRMNAERAAHGKQESTSEWWRKIADRIEAGYRGEAF